MVGFGVASSTVCSETWLETEMKGWIEQDAGCVHRVTDDE